jgi:hypothetical protein
VARLESVAVAGYFPTPEHIVPRIAALLEPTDGRTSFVDPCAGEGSAILTLLQKLSLDPSRADLYACEMESGRAVKLNENAQAVSWGVSKNCLEGDAFCVAFEVSSESGASVLYLNPPYDLDPVHGRLEQRWLTRFSNTLTEGGVLLFVVPHYALKASADLLAKEYTDVRCFRFPQEDFESFKQVVVYAKKRHPLFDPDPIIRQMVLGWSADVKGEPELPKEGDEPIGQLLVTERYYSGPLSTWQIKPIDVDTILKKVRPWKQMTRSGALVPTQGIIPDMPIQDLLLRTYPVATPPRPAHIAAGIASGLFNGSRIEPTDPSTKLPSLLVKGVFDREYRTIEEKTNKHGEVKSVVQVQQPKLVTTVLDLNTHQYHVLKSNTDETNSTDVSNMGVADLLKHYGNSLMSVMERQCPITYDPRRDAGKVTIAPSPRKLFSAQAHAVRALVTLLGGDSPEADRRFKSAYLLGEIGSGKSTCALMTAKTCRAKRILVLCPPHLLQGWADEVSYVTPEAEVRVISSVEDLDYIRSNTSERPIVAVLSRETAKLSHGWLGVEGTCPKCGQTVPKGDLAKKRARCEYQDIVPVDRLANLAVNVALKLSTHCPSYANVGNLLRSRFSTQRLSKYEKKPKKFIGLDKGLLEELLGLLIERFSQDRSERVERAIIYTLLTFWSDELVASTAKKVIDAESVSYRHFGRDLLLLLTPNCDLQKAIVEDNKSKETYSYYGSWSSFSQSLEGVVKGEKYSRISNLGISWKDDLLVVEDAAPLSLDAAQNMLDAIISLSRFKRTPECGEFLFQADASPRRVSVARHILKYHSDLFDFMVLDEGHEYSTDGSAQERAAHRLTSLGAPTILMTGTIMNGYSESLFTNMWALSPEFRLEFEREDKQRFIDRYGYRKRILEDKDKETGDIVEFGSMSDRITRSERVVGNAPGVLPLFVLKHLLPISVTLHKADLAIDLPACRQERHLVDPGSELMKRFRTLQSALITQIKRDRFVVDRAGKLFGQLAELPSYLDRATADTGNSDSGAFEIRYPESLNNEMVVSQEPFPADNILPKEQWLLDKIEAELEEGRNVLVFSWHVTLLPRLARLIEAKIGSKVPILYANKVPTAKRQEWINREIVKKDRRVMITNPVAIQTGLNNLVHFHTEVWMENPACNPVIFRQAIGRVDRIGQKKETRILYPIYADSLQVQLYDLLMQKVTVSISTDGLDPESSLQAAGVGEDEYFAGLSIGKQIWAMLTEGIHDEAA